MSDMQCRVEDFPLSQAELTSGSVPPGSVFPYSFSDTQLKQWLGEDAPRAIAIASSALAQGNILPGLGKRSIADLFQMGRQIQADEEYRCRQHSEKRSEHAREEAEKKKAAEHKRHDIENPFRGKVLAHAVGEKETARGEEETRKAPEGKNLLASALAEAAAIGGSLAAFVTPASVSPHTHHSTADEPHVVETRNQSATQTVANNRGVFDISDFFSGGTPDPMTAEHGLPAWIAPQRSGQSLSLAA